MGNDSTTNPMNPSLQTIPLDQIRRRRANPRRSGEDDLGALTASLGSEQAPTLVQPPILEQVGPGEYVIIAGERRILAARQAGWRAIACIVHARLDPFQAFTMHLCENLHRKDLHPLDEAAVLKIAWLCANAEGIGQGEAARAVLQQDVPPLMMVTGLETMLKDHGFSPTHPAVPWEQLLARLGLHLDAERRKKLMRVLNIDTGIQEQVRSLDVTEAALRAIGTLDAADQQRLVTEIKEDPGLARKVRRIARVVRDGSYTLDEALAEAHGALPGEAPSGTSTMEMGREDLANGSYVDPMQLDDRPMSAAMELLEIANRLSTALVTLNEVVGGDLAMLPQPWGAYAQEALELIRAEVGQFASQTQKGV